MSISTKTFEVAVDGQSAALAFDIRGAAMDFIRLRICQTLERAEDAEIDRATALRRFSLTYAAAAKGYRLPRAIPASLVNWCAYVEMNRVRDGFPEALPGSVGSFNKDIVMSLPGNVMLVKMGGVTFAGVLEGGKPEDLIEVRVSPTSDGKYMAILVCGRFDDGGEDAPVPEPSEHQDA